LVAENAVGAPAVAPGGVLEGVPAPLAVLLLEGPGVEGGPVDGP
jgi:hypothetical protein